MAFLGVSRVATVGNTEMIGWRNVAIRQILDNAGVDPRAFSSHSFQFYHDASTTDEFWRDLAATTQLDTVHRRESGQ